MMENEKSYRDNNGLIKHFNNTDKNILLSAEGGMGKSTLMADLFNYLLAEGSDTVPLYIDCKSIRSDKSLYEFIFEKYCGSTEYFKRVEDKRSAISELLKKRSANGSVGCRYVLLIDGVNELNSDNRYRVLNDVDDLLGEAEAEQVRFVISSRVAEDDFRGDERFVFLNLKPLEVEKIRNYIKEEFNEEPDREINPSLLEILQIPLYLKIFRLAYDRRSPFPDLYEERKVRRSQLLFGYIEKLRKDAREKDREQRSLIDFLLTYWLPKIAFDMATKGEFFISDDVIDNYSRSLSGYFDSVVRPRRSNPLLEEYKKRVRTYKDDDFFNTCLADLRLFEANADGDYQFIHQIWRDFFAACHVVNLMNAAKIDELEEELSVDIRQFVGELVCTYDAKLGYSRARAVDDRLCECDFEDKTDLSDPRGMSPIEHFLQNDTTQLNENPIIIRNLIEIMKTSRNGKITACYNNLDLKYVVFGECYLSGSDFKGGSVYMNTFLPEGHTDTIEAIAVTSDSKYIISCSYDKTIRIWDIKKRIQVGEPLTGHKGWITAVAITHDGKYIVSASVDGSVRIWDFNTRRQVKRPIYAHIGPLYSIAISKDGKIICGSRNGRREGTIKIFDIKTRKQLGVLRGHRGRVTSLAVTPDCKHIISSSEDGTVRIWDSTKKTAKFILSGRQRIANQIAVLPDNKSIVVGGYDGMIHFFDVESGKEICDPLIGYSDETLDERGKSIKAIAISPDGKYIVCNDNSILEPCKIWRCNDSSAVYELYFEAFLYSSGRVTITPDNKYLVYTDSSDYIGIWDIEKKISIGEPLKGYNKEVSSIAVSPSGAFVVSELSDGTLRIFDASNCRQTKKMQLDEINTSKNILLFPDQKHLVYGGFDKKVHILDIENQKELWKSLSGHDGYIYSVALSPDGKYIASGSKDRTIRIWNAVIFRESYTPLTNHEGSVTSVAITPDGKKIVSGSEDKTVRVWDIESGTQLDKSSHGHKRLVSCVKVLPDQKAIVSGSWDKTLKIWDINNLQKPKKTLRGHKDFVYSVAITSDGKYAVSSSADKTIRIWHIAGGRRKGKPITGHTSYIRAVETIPVSRMIVSGSDDGTLRFWDLGTKTQRIIRPIDADIYDCNFKGAVFKTERIRKLCSVLYFNGADVPEEYIPRPLPFGAEDYDG